MLARFRTSPPVPRELREQERLRAAAVPPSEVSGKRKQLSGGLRHDLADSDLLVRSDAAEDAVEAAAAAGALAQGDVLARAAAVIEHSRSLFQERERGGLDTSGASSRGSARSLSAVPFAGLGYAASIPSLAPRAALAALRRSVESAASAAGGEVVWPPSGPTPLFVPPVLPVQPHSGASAHVSMYSHAYGERGAGASSLDATYIMRAGAETKGPARPHLSPSPDVLRALMGEGQDASDALYATAEAILCEDPEATVERLRRRLAHIDVEAAPLLAPYLPVPAAGGDGWRQSAAVQLSGAAAAAVLEQLTPPRPSPMYEVRAKAHEGGAAVDLVAQPEVGGGPLSLVGLNAAIDHTLLTTAASEFEEGGDGGATAGAEGAEARDEGDESADSALWLSDEEAEEAPKAEADGSGCAAAKPDTRAGASAPAPARSTAAALTRAVVLRGVPAAPPAVTNSLLARLRAARALAEG